MPSRVIVLTVSAIQYEGESVGREIALDVGLAGEFLTSNLRLAPGQTRELARDHHWGSDDPLFPATQMGRDANGDFTPVG